MVLLCAFGEQLRLRELGDSAPPFKRPGRPLRRLGRVGRGISVANALLRSSRYTTSNIWRNDQHGKQDSWSKRDYKQNLQCDAVQQGELV